MVKLSCYIVTYNRKWFLQKQIESVLNQTYKNFILFILDNNSTDGTESVVRKYDDERIVYIRHNENIGGINNIKYAFSHCSTEYIIVLHDDDYVDSRLFEKEILQLENNKMLSLVSCNSIRIDEHGNIYKEIKKIRDNRLYQGDDYFREYMKKGNTLVFPSIMYRMSFIRNNNIEIDEKAGPCCDVIFCVDIFNANGVALELSDALLFYRVHNCQDTSLHYLDMHLMLFKYLSLQSRYKELMAKTRCEQKRRFVFFGKVISRKLLRSEITYDDACNEIDLLSSIFGISKGVKKYEYLILKMCKYGQKIFNVARDGYRLSQKIKNK